MMDECMGNIGFESGQPGTTVGLGLRRLHFKFERARQGCLDGSHGQNLEAQFTGKQMPRLVLHDLENAH